MQSAPTEGSQTSTSVNHPQGPSSSTHHGLPDSHLQASGNPLREDAGEPPTNRPNNSLRMSVPSDDTSRGRQAHAGRLSKRQDSSQESTPGSRIDEYEKAHANVRKLSDGMIFQVIPNAKSTNVSIDEFPNGMSQRH